MKNLRLFVSTVSFFLAAQTMATPAQVVIIRHGEKPAQGNEVNSQGCERAYALTRFFQDDRDVNAFGKPAAIYAQAPDKANGSLRPIQTIAPTAEKLGMKINASFIRKQFPKMAKEILNSPEFNGKTVWISWEHTVIPDVAQAFGLPASQTPGPWPGDVFDQAWILSFDNATNSTQVTLRIIPENALPTDNPDINTAWTAGPQTPTHSSPNLDPQVAAECVNNNDLNAIVREVTMPNLPAAVFDN